MNDSALFVGLHANGMAYRNPVVKFSGDTHTPRKVAVTAQDLKLGDVCDGLAIVKITKSAMHVTIDLSDESVLTFPMRRRIEVTR